MLSSDIKKEIVDGLVDICAHRIDSIVLYGSVARGEATDDSDVDIAIILVSSMAKEEIDAFIHWNAQMDLKYGKIFSIVDIDKSNIEKWGNMLPFYRNIKDEGVVLWKAA